MHIKACMDRFDGQDNFVAALADRPIDPRCDEPRIDKSSNLPALVSHFIAIDATTQPLS
ncbi:hypothetical protein SV7mr_29790 [Stieleria bergensis]|uniref:Uncharacterized protein n=1 Tax=Stieleria bergensis TaxID=2528025 RepID=A0A517SWE6_9BACT|nr:hypothetical protein SV7mr_29790 [Planctomycetes bacterium SV_7m_r]